MRVHLPVIPAPSREDDKLYFGVNGYVVLDPPYPPQPLTIQELHRLYDPPPEVLAT